MNERKIKKTAIYPYHAAVFAIVRYLETLNPIYQIEKIVTPSIRGNGVDAGRLFNKTELGIIVTNDIDEAIDTCDCLIIAEGAYADKLRQLIMDKIKSALHKKKEVICTLKLTKKELESLGAENFCHLPDHPEEVKIPDISKKLYSPNAPVIFVGEMTNGLDGFDITLGMTNFFRKEGYRTVTIAERSWSGLLNIKAIPDFMRHHDIDENSKVYAFNQRIKELEQKENPSVFIIQLPGALMKFNDKLTAGFGIIPYLISLAVQAEYMIVSTFYDTMNSVFFETLSERFEHQIGVGIDALCISNTFIDIPDSMEKNIFSYLRIEQKKVNEEVEKLNQTGEIPTYNCCNPEEFKEMCQQIIAGL